MIGVDLTTISRFKNCSDNFVSRVLSQQELKSYLQQKNKSLFLATRWAIKEALFKADNQLNEFKAITIEKIANRYCYKNFYISTSKEQDLVIATVIKRNE